MEHVKRAFLGGVLLLVVATLVYGLAVTRRERQYRRLVVQGDYALARGQSFEAVDAFGQAIALRPDSMLGYLKRGEAHRRRGDLDAAAADLVQACELDPASPRALEMLGDVEEAQLLHDRAAAHYAASAAVDDRPRVFYKLALALHLADRHAEAHDATATALALDPRFAEAEYLQGVVFRALGKPREAERALERALALDARLLPAREQLAELYGALGRRAERVAELERLLKADPGPGRETTLALAYAAMGQTTRALRQLRRGAEIYPDYAGIYLALGQVWLQSGEIEGDYVALAKATEAIEHAIAIEPSAAALAMLGRTLLMKQDVTGAMTVLRDAAGRLPADPATFLHLADVAERRGAVEEARQALINHYALLEPAARTAALAERLGDLSLRLADGQAAVRWFQTAAGDRPTTGILARLAGAQLAAGDTAGARATLAQLLEKEPGNASGRDLARQLPSPN